MGLIDYMILSERFQGIRVNCVKPSLVDAVILLKSITPIALLYLFGVRLLVGFGYAIFATFFLYFYLKREEQVLSALFDNSGANRTMSR